MTTAEELVVSITSEGTKETQDDLDGVERSMEDTADSAGNSADELEGFSKKFKGAMGAAVAALAVGAAGLMSQVPVLGELMAGLFAIVEALAFQMDSVLRPVLSPLTDRMFEWANAIFEADGALGTLIGVGATVASILGIVAAVGWKLGVSLSAVASAGGAVVAALKAGVGTILFVASLFEPITTAIMIAVAALLLLRVAWENNWLGIRDITNNAVGWIMDTVVGGFKDLGRRALNALTNFASGVADALTDLAGRLSDWASGLASTAYEWGVSLVQGLLSGILSLAETVVEAFQGVINRIIGTINTALDVLPDEVSSRVGVEQFQRVDFSSDLGGGRGGEATGGGRSRPRFGAGRGASTGGQTLDGRQLSESTGRYRSDPGRRRGI